MCVPKSRKCPILKILINENGKEDGYENKIELSETINLHFSRKGEGRPISEFKVI